MFEISLHFLKIVSMNSKLILLYSHRMPLDWNSDHNFSLYHQREILGNFYLPLNYGCMISGSLHFVSWCFSWRKKTHLCKETVSYTRKSFKTPSVSRMSFRSRYIFHLSIWNNNIVSALHIAWALETSL